MALYDCCMRVAADRPGGQYDLTRPPVLCQAVSGELQLSQEMVIMTTDSTGIIIIIITLLPATNCDQADPAELARSYARGLSGG